MSWRLAGDLRFWINLLFIGINFLEFRICTLAYSSKLIVLNQSICVLVVIVDGVVIDHLSSCIKYLLDVNVFINKINEDEMCYAL